MKNVNFDKTLFKHVENILINCIDYTNNSSSKIDIVYVYISFEWVIFYNVYFKLTNDVFYKKHKINAFIEDVDVSPERQSALNKKNNYELGKVKSLFEESEREVPTQIKIIYSSLTGKNKIKFNYEKLHNDELFIGDDDLAEEWFEELQSGNGDIE